MGTGYRPRKHRFNWIYLKEISWDIPFQWGGGTNLFDSIRIGYFFILNIIWAVFQCHLMPRCTACGWCTGPRAWTPGSGPPCSTPATSPSRRWWTTSAPSPSCSSPSSLSSFAPLSVLSTTAACSSFSSAVLQEYWNTALMISSKSNITMSFLLFQMEKVDISRTKKKLCKFFYGKISTYIMLWGSSLIGYLQSFVKGNRKIKISLILP